MICPSSRVLKREKDDDQAEKKVWVLINITKDCVLGVGRCLVLTHQKTFVELKWTQGNWHITNLPWVGFPTIPTPFFRV